MFEYSRRIGRDGFTLIEVLVTLLLLSLLAAAVFPVITQQVSRGEPVKASQDLSSIRTGIETFSLNVRPSYPGDLDDLIAPITEAATAPSIAWSASMRDCGWLSSARAWISSAVPALASRATTFDDSRPHATISAEARVNKAGRWL